MNLRKKPDGTYESHYGEIEAIAYDHRSGWEERASHLMIRPGHENWIEDDPTGWHCKVCGASYPHQERRVVNPTRTPYHPR